MNPPNKNPELPGGVLYCQEPASTDPTTGRGIWATYLDPHGSDSKKKISTHQSRFSVYRTYVVRLVSECISRVNEGVLSKSQLSARIKKLTGVQISTEETLKIREITACELNKLNKALERLMVNIFPNIQVSRDVKKIEVTLRYIATFYFERENGEWELSKIEYGGAET